MPLIKLQQDTTRALALWKIEESEAILLSLVEDTEQIPISLTHPQKRLEYIAGRVAVKELMLLFNYKYEGIKKNEFGRPLLINCPLYISISHSFPYVAAVIDTQKIVGVDVEQVKTKLNKIASRVFNDIEINSAGNNVIKLCVLWCAKEALIKLYGKKDLILRDELHIEPFLLSDTGKLTGSITKINHKNSYHLEYLVEEDFVLVYSL
jgi:4'-phosphopantetheinyl transferase